MRGQVCRAAPVVRRAAPAAVAATHYPFSLFNPPISRVSSGSCPDSSCPEFDNLNGMWAGESGTKIWGYWVTKKPQGTGKFPAASPIFPLWGTY